MKRTDRWALRIAMVLWLGLLLSYRYYIPPPPESWSGEVNHKSIMTRETIKYFTIYPENRKLKWDGEER